MHLILMFPLISLSLSLFLPLFLPISPSLYLSMYLFFSFCLFVSFRLYVSIYLFSLSLSLISIIRVHENGLYNQWKHELRYACGVEEERHPQKNQTATDDPLSLEDIAICFRLYGLSN